MDFRKIYSLENEIDEFKDSLGRIRSYSIKNNTQTPFLSRALFDNGFKPTYPNNKKMCVTISHDVDYVFDSKPLISSIERLVKSALKLKFHDFAEEFNSSIIKQQKRKWSLDRIIDFEKNKSVASTYFFLALKRGDRDFNYHIDQLLPQIKKLIKNKSEIAFHGGLDAYNCEEKFIDEYKRLQKLLPDVKVNGYRSHFLQYDHIKTHDILESLEFDYDGTIGLPDNIGFRNGMCYPFRPINLKTGDYRNILEIPLNVMDVSFFKYMNLNCDSAFHLFVKVFNEVKVLNGVLSILWHNNNLDSEYEKLYFMIMDFVLKDNQIWIATHSELSQFWQKNHTKNLELTLEKLYKL